MSITYQPKKRKRQKAHGFLKELIVNLVGKLLNSAEKRTEKF